MTKKILKTIGYSLTLLVIGLTMYVLVFGSIAIKNNKLLNIFGYSYGYVPTPSMDGIAPEDAKIKSFKKGSIVIIKIGGFDDLEINDVVVFESNEGMLKVHRIIEKYDNYYITKGDSTSSQPDTNDPVTNSNYQGKVINVFYLFGLGSIITNLRSILLLVIIFSLLVYFLIQVYNLVKIRNENKNKLSEDEINKIVEERVNKIIKDEINEKK